MRSITVAVTCSFGKFQTEEELKGFGLFSLPRNVVGIFFFFCRGGIDLEN